MTTSRAARSAALLLILFLPAACAKKQPPVARPMPVDPAGAESPTPAAEPPRPMAESPNTVPPEPVLTEESLEGKPLDEINRNSPLKPVFYGLDESEIDAVGQQVLQSNAEVLRRYPRWQITIEGHADERGTAEYNLALGERRAMSARAYLISLGIPADRIKTVSYGKEFPFDPGHTEEAWAKNRRAHFVVTAK